MEKFIGGYEESREITEHIISAREHLFTYRVAAWVQAMIPEYIKEFPEDAGLNGTRLILAQDSHHMLLKKSYKSSFDKLMRETGHDYKMLTELYKEVVDKDSGIPIPLTDYNVLIQLRLREPQGPKDGAMGRVNCMNIVDIHKVGEHQTRITFADGLQLICLQKLSHVKMQLIDGYLVGMNYRNRFGGGYGDAGSDSRENASGLAAAMAAMIKRLSPKDRDKE